MDKLKRVQEMMFSGKAEDIALEKIFGEALDLFIDKHCPEERQKRRAERQAKKPVELKNSPERRFIPVWLRDEVLKRDDHCCTYTTPGGHRCSCPVGLEIDHIVPVARGGKTEIKNLRVLCSTHNILAAKEVFGRGFVEKKIQQSRKEKALGGG